MNRKYLSFLLFLGITLIASPYSFQLKADSGNRMGDSQLLEVSHKPIVLLPPPTETGRKEESHSSLRLDGVVFSGRISVPLDFVNQTIEEYNQVLKGTGVSLGKIREGRCEIQSLLLGLNFFQLGVDHEYLEAESSYSGSVGENFIDIDVLASAEGWLGKVALGLGSDNFGVLLTVSYGPYQATFYRSVDLGYPEAPFMYKSQAGEHNGYKIGIFARYKIWLFDFYIQGGYRDLKIYRLEDQKGNVQKSFDPPLLDFSGFEWTVGIGAGLKF